MPKQIDALSDAMIRTAKPAAKARKLFDGLGLYLEVSPAGGKWWRFKYRYGGKEKRISLGTYPDVKLKKARDLRDQARDMLRDGIDPAEKRKAEKVTRGEQAENSFEAIAREWHTKYGNTWTEGHAARILRRLEADIFPRIGSRPITEVTPPDLLAALRRVEDRGALETAHRELQVCGQVFRYGVATGRCERDISQDLKGALPPVKGKHLAAVTEPDKVAPLLRMIDGYQGTPQVMAALKLAPLVFVRPGELRQAEWKDFDLDAAEWRYTVTKTGTPHVVPLSTQALSILRDLHPVTGHGRYVFPSARSNARPMSDNAVLAAMRRMGIAKDEMSGHGFRAMARTILDEVLGFRPDYIEHQLAHAVRDPNGRAYNRTAHLPERHKMMQAWADYLDALKTDANVVALKAVR